MKSLWALALISILLLPLTFQIASGQQPPPNTEDLEVSILGSTALWRIRFRGPDFGLPSLKDFEPEFQNVTSYRMVVVKAGNWKKEYIPLSREGYNFLDFPIPLQGAILEVDSKNAEVRERFVSKVGEAFKLLFFPYPYPDSKGLYYSHASFAFLVRNLLWKAIPPTFGGYANLASLDSLLKMDPAFVSISAERKGNEFSRRFEVIGISELPSNLKQFNLQTILPTAKDTNSSKSSSASKVIIRVVGGFIEAKEGEGSLRNIPANETGVMEFSVPTGKPLPMSNMTLVRNFPIILVTRTIDQGALRAGETVEVKITVRNIGTKGSIPAENIRLKEEWWNKQFTKIAGGTDITISTLDPGDKRDFPYQLGVAVNATAFVSQTRDESMVTYSYRAGNQTISKTVQLNPLRISLNSPAPSLEFNVSPSSPNPPLGSEPAYTFSIKNRGSRSAFNLKVLDRSKVLMERDTLASGGNWTFVASPPGEGLAKIREARYFVVQWVEEGRTVTLESNSAELYYDPKEAGIPIPIFTKTHKVIESGGKTFLNITLSLKGPTRSSTPTINLLDKGSPLLRFVNGSLIPKEGLLEAKIEPIKPNETRYLSYLMELPQPENIVLPPAHISMTWRESVVSLLSGSSALALAIKIEKTVAPSLSFAGGQAMVKSILTNLGKNPVYNSNLTDNPAPYRLVSGLPNKTSDILVTGMKIELEYIIQFGNSESRRVNPATASFILSGEIITVTSRFLPVHIFEPIRASISTLPTIPTEKKTFEAIVTIENPSNLTVSQVMLTLPKAKGLSIVSGNLSGSWAGLKGGDRVELRATVVSDSGTEVHIGPPEITFVYEGHKLQGSGVKANINISDDIPVRYLIPMAVAVVALAATIFATRRILKVGTGKD